MKIDIEKFLEFLNCDNNMEKTFKPFFDLSDDYKITKLENELYMKLVNLMIDDLSDKALYTEDATKYCEVMRKECVQNENITCKECLLRYYIEKAKVVLENEDKGINSEIK